MIGSIWFHLVSWWYALGFPLHYISSSVSVCCFSPFCSFLSIFSTLFWFHYVHSCLYCFVSHFSVFHTSLVQFLSILHPVLLIHISLHLVVNFGSILVHLCPFWFCFIYFFSLLHFVLSVFPHPLSAPFLPIYFLLLLFVFVCFGQLMSD